MVEGLGAHGCEYMTGGCVVGLGQTGWNLAAGMSGGDLFVYDPKGTAVQALNDEMAGVCDLDGEAEARLKALIEAHVAATQSPLGQRILGDWANHRTHFVHVAPKTVIAAKAATTDLRLAEPA